uniref:Uncharacterized protein n=1 Tax=Oryza punctata TaxID=4537 RepID=A0A0E0JSR1_ORYPU
MNYLFGPSDLMPVANVVVSLGSGARGNAIKKKLANPHPTPAAGCRSSSLSRDPSSPADGCSTATPPSPDWRDLMSLALPPLPPRPPPDRGSRPSTTRPRAASPPSGFGGTVLQPAPEIRPRPPQPPPPTQPHAEQQLVTLSPQKVAKMVAGEASRSSILFGPPSFYRRRRRLPLATVAGIGRWAPTGCSFRWLWHRNPIGPKLPWVVLLATIDMRVPIIVSHPRCQLTTPLAPKFPPSVHSVGAGHSY